MSEDNINKPGMKKINKFDFFFEEKKDIFFREIANQKCLTSTYRGSLDDTTTVSSTPIISQLKRTFIWLGDPFAIEPEKYKSKYYS